MDIYQEQILDHYRNRRNFGRLEKPSASLELANSLCGDAIGMEIKVTKLPARRSFNAGGETRNWKLENIKFWGEGCVISQATASMLTEKVKGKSFEQIKKIGQEEILKMLGIELSPARLKCAFLPLEVLQKVLDRYSNF